MMTFYAAAGSYQIRNEDGKDMPYINALSQNLFFYRDMIESFADTVDSTTIEERRRLLRTIVKKVVWDGKNVYVYLFAEDGELNLPPIGQLMCPSGEDSE